MVGWQARLNYTGDKMRVQGFNAAPFTDNFTDGFTTRWKNPSLGRWGIPNDELDRSA